MRTARVVLLGWADSKPSQLRVFERMYESFGIEPLSTTASFTRSLLQPECFSRVANSLARVLANDGGTRPTFIHIFSDNGFATWGALLAQLSATENGRRSLGAVRGIVFDSAPGLWATEGTIDLARYLAVGTASVVTSRLKLAQIPPVNTLLKTALFATSVAYRFTFRSNVRRIFTTVGHVRTYQPLCPNLYLYSGVDDIVLPRNVHAWIEGQRRRGISCEAHEFEGARHVGIYSYDPEQYRELVEAFVKSALHADPALEEDDQSSVES